MTRYACRAGLVAAVALGLAFAAGCGKKTSPVARPAPPPTVAPTAPPTTPGPTERLGEPEIVEPEALGEGEDLSAKSLDELNRDSPFEPVFFALDSNDLSPEAQATLRQSAEILKKNMTWVVTIEGHCDERGTAQYNLALGERRAMTARTYLQSLGIEADRLRTVSYGKEFPFDPGHNEEAWARNRRAHFVITAK